MRSIISLYMLFFNQVLLLWIFISCKETQFALLEKRYTNALSVMHSAIILPVRTTRCHYRLRAWIWVRLTWPGSAAQDKLMRCQTRQAIALRRPGAPWFWKILYATSILTPTCPRTSQCPRPRLQPLLAPIPSYNSYDIYIYTYLVTLHWWPDTN